MLWQKVGSRPYRYLARAKPSWSMIISWRAVWGGDLSVCSQLWWPHQGALLVCHPCACVRHVAAPADKLSGCRLDLIPAGGVGFQSKFMGAGSIVILSILQKTILDAHWISSQSLTTASPQLQPSLSCAHGRAVGISSYPCYITSKLFPLETLTRT